MNRSKKILSIALCMIMLIGMVAMVATAKGITQQQIPQAYAAKAGAVKQGLALDMVAPSRVNSVFGYYRDGTGEDETTFVNGNDGAGLTDGWYGRPGSSNSTSKNGLIAAIFTVDEIIQFGGIEIVANDRNGEGDGDIRDFDIQAWVDGKWVELVSEKGYLFDEKVLDFYVR